MRFQQPSFDPGGAEGLQKERSGELSDDAIKGKTRKRLIWAAAFTLLLILGGAVPAIFRYRPALAVQKYVSAGEACHQRSDFECAAENFTKAVQSDPLNIDAYFKRGNAYYYLGKYDDAIVDYNKVIDKNPFGFVFKIRGRAYHLKGNIDQALRDYNKAIEWDPQDDDAYLNRGDIYSSKAKYDEAVTNYDKALSLKSDNRSIQNNSDHIEESRSATCSTGRRIPLALRILH